MLPKPTTPTVGDQQNTHCPLADSQTVFHRGKISYKSPSTLSRNVSLSHPHVIMPRMHFDPTPRSSTTDYLCAQLYPLLLHPRSIAAPKRLTASNLTPLCCSMTGSFFTDTQIKSAGIPLFGRLEMRNPLTTEFEGGISCSASVLEFSLY